MQSFEEVYEENYQTIFNYCLRRVGEFNDARDITSQTFIKALINFHKFKWKGIPVKHWLYRIATNEVRLFYRSRKYNPIMLYEGSTPWPEPVVDLEAERRHAEDELKKNAQFLAASRAIKKLPLRYQEPITLRYFEEMSIREISEVLDKKEGTVKSLLSRGIARIRDELNATT